MAPLPPTYQDPKLAKLPWMVSSGVAFVIIFGTLAIISCILCVSYWYYVKCKNWDAFHKKLSKQWRNVKLWFCCQYVRHVSLLPSSFLPSKKSIKISVSC